MDITEENEPYCAAREADFVVDKRGAHDAVGDTGAGAAPRSSSATPADAATRSDNLPRVATAPSASAVPQSSRAEAAVPGPTPAGSAAPTPPAVASGNAPSPSDCAAKSPCRGPSTRSRKSARRRQPAPAAQLPDHSYDSLCGECGYEEHQESIQEAEEAAEEEHEARRDLETATDDHRRAEAQRRVDAALARQKSAVDKGCLMVCCDGRCLRSFHVACMHDPSVVDDDSDEEWLCQDCTTRNHRCDICHEFAGFEVPEGVVRCLRPACASFYHIGCLAKQPWRDRVRWRANAPSRAVLDALAGADGSLEATTKAALLSRLFNEHGVPEFLCPRHRCDVCGERSTATGRGRQAEYQSCRHCPRGYHLKCIPPLAEYNDLAFHCPLHRREPLPRSFSWVEMVNAARAGRSSHAKEHVRTAAVGVRGHRGYAVMPGLDADTFGMPVLNAPKACFNLPKPLVLEMLTRPPRFTMLHTNRYTAAAAAAMQKERAKRRAQSDMKSYDTAYGVCSCTEECGDECENRLLRIECFGGDDEADGELPEQDAAESPPPAAANKRRRKPQRGSNCGCRAVDCGNRRFAQRQWKRLTPFRTRDRGWGLRTADRLQAGEFIIEYTGEVIDDAEQEARLRQAAERGEMSYYIMNLDTRLGLSVDARDKGCVARFANHSCAPNCEVQRWDVAQGRMCLGLFALKDIEAGEEVTYDYNFATAERTACLCGAETCRGFLSAQVAREAKRDQLHCA